MFRALISDNEHVISTDSNIEHEEKGFYQCPICREPVFLKSGKIKISHFSHYSKNNIDHWWEPESELHMEMKQFVYDYFKNKDYVKKIEYEVRIDIENGFLVSDILIITQDGYKIAIECQISKYNREKIMEKTHKYSKSGIYVLWIFHEYLYKYLYKHDKALYKPFWILSDDNKNHINRYYIYSSNHEIYAIETIKNYRNGKNAIIRENNNITFEGIKKIKGELLIIYDSNAIRRYKEINVLKVERTNAIGIVVDIKELSAELNSRLKEFQERRVQNMPYEN